LNSSPNILRAINSRRIRWEGHASRLGELYTAFLLENLEDRYHFGDLRLVFTIILKLILKKEV
jgi:hypothetical protein